MNHFESIKPVWVNGVEKEIHSSAITPESLLICSYDLEALCIFLTYVAMYCSTSFT